jgi:hypothetical protein
MNISQAEVELRKMSFQKGDIIVMRYPQGLPPSSLQQMIESFNQSLISHFGDERPFYILLPEGYEMEKLTDEDLAQAGLARIDTPVVVEGT